MGVLGWVRAKAVGEDTTWELNRRLALLRKELDKEKVVNRRLAEANQSLRSDLHRLAIENDRTVKRLQDEIDGLQSIINIRQLEIKELTEVVVRNRTRVQQESAIASANIELAKQHQGGRPGDRLILGPHDR